MLLKAFRLQFVLEVSDCILVQVRGGGDPQMSPSPTIPLVQDQSCNAAAWTIIPRIMNNQFVFLLIVIDY